MTFEEHLTAYKQAIDADIARYSAHVHSATKVQYGEYPAVVTDAFLDLLGRGGKRLRGALTMVGYQMCGGQDSAMIVRAATAMEMIHAYVLLIDDIQDRSRLRRGKPTVHELLAAYHRRHHLKGNAAHAGLSLALDAAMAGGHAAHMLLLGLDADAELRIKAAGIVSHTLVVTAHGQTYDITNQLTPQVSRESIDRAMELKTAHYTFLNPLCVGMVLAGAGCESTDAIREYALHAGIAFQIADDCIGMFGTAKASGKDPMDDMREGKRTLLIDHALAHSSAADQKFLHACLGNAELTKTDFKRARNVIETSGARSYVQGVARQHVAAARASLAAAQQGWNRESVQFLESLVTRLLA